MSHFVVCRLRLLNVRRHFPRSQPREQLRRHRSSMIPFGGHTDPSIAGLCPLEIHSQTTDEQNRPNFGDFSPPHLRSIGAFICRGILHYFAW